jgi:hypothetical protein
VDAVLPSDGLGIWSKIPRLTGVLGVSWGKYRWNSHKNLIKSEYLNKKILIF